MQGSLVKALLCNSADEALWRVNGDVHAIALSADVWNGFGLEASDITTCIALSNPIAEDFAHRRHAFKTLLCYAHMLKDIKLTESAMIPPQTLSLVFSGYTDPDLDDLRVRIRRCQLIALDEVVISALDEQSYQLAQTDPASIIAVFKGANRDTAPLVVRQGFTYHVKHKTAGDEGVLRYRVLMAGPVLQGVVNDSTSFIFTEGNEEDGPGLEAANGIDYASDNEDLLASNLPLSQSMTFPPIVSSDSTSLDYNPPSFLTTSPVEFTLQHQLRPIPDSLLTPTPDPKDDEINRCYVGVKGLAALGVFSGDWVLVSGVDHKRSRLCRVFGLESDLFWDYKERSDQLPVYISPLLRFNLGFPGPPEQDKDAITRLYITRLPEMPTSSGTNTENGWEEVDCPPIPVAKAVTVARVASPASISKVLQESFLRNLRNWFEIRKRIVCKGDLIAVGINETEARIRPAGSTDIEWEDFSASSKATNVVYFKITEVEFLGEGEASSYFGFGRRVDPSLTKLVQMGLEHSRLPSGPVIGSPDETFELPLDGPRQQLSELMNSSLHPISSELDLSCHVLLHGSRGIGKRTLVETVAREYGVHMYEVNCYEIAGETDQKTEAAVRVKFDNAMTCAPCILLLRHIDALARKSAALESGQEPAISAVLEDCFRLLQEAQKEDKFPVIVIATTGDIEKIPASVLGTFKHEIKMDAPDEAARLTVLQNLTAKCTLAPDVLLESLATQTAALLPKDMVELVASAGLSSMARVTKMINSNGSKISDADIIGAGVALTASDFDAALNKARASYSDSIGAPKIPNVTWDDVGGMAHVKSDILDTIQLPLDHPELFSSGMKKRSGILLYGPPGTGKTLLAKAIATSCSLNFFSVKGPELLNMYIGESEANVRRVFQKARDAKPCVIFFDELDSVAPKRGEKGDSGGVMDRIVSQLLAELDGMSEGGGSADVFVIGATNRPDLLDSALLRPGRFDKLLYLGVSQTHEAQLKIIQALTRKFRLSPDLDLARVAEKCPFNYTGADFYALCSDAMLKAMTRVAQSVEDKVAHLEASADETASFPRPLTSQYYLSHLAVPEDLVVQVCEEDFDKAMAELVPSVSEKELQHYLSVREKFEGDQKEGSETKTEMNGSMLGPIEAPKALPNGPSKNKGKGKAPQLPKEIHQDGKLLTICGGTSNNIAVLEALNQDITTYTDCGTSATATYTQTATATETVIGGTTVIVPKSTATSSPDSNGIPTTVNGCVTPTTAAEISAYFSNPVCTYGNGITIADAVGAAVMIAFGLYLVFLGYRFWFLTLMVIGFIFSALIAWIALTNFEPLGGYPNQTVVYLGVCAGVGVVFALIFVCLVELLTWVIGGIFGFLLAVWILAWSQNHLIPNQTWRTIFIVGLTVVGFVVGIVEHHWVIIISTSFIGAVMFMWGVDLLAHTGYIQAIISLIDVNPNHFHFYALNTKVYVMLAMTAVVFLIGVVVQHFFYVRKLSQAEFRPNRVSLYQAMRSRFGGHKLLKGKEKEEGA